VVLTAGGEKLLGARAKLRSLPFRPVERQDFPRLGLLPQLLPCDRSGRHILYVHANIVKETTCTDLWLKSMSFHVARLTE
jgi:hypothetical protein